MKGLIAHKAGDGGLANLLCDDDDVPVVEFMGDVLDGVLAAVLAPGHEAHILLVELDVDLSQAIHWL